MIYVTSFKNSNKQCTGTSTDSGFSTLDDVVSAIGPPEVPRSKKTLIYGQGEDRVIFSCFTWHVDATVSNGYSSVNNNEEVNK